MFERVFQHRMMLADQVRMEAYKKAINEVIRKGDIVVDIGTGSGVLAFFAVQAGARKGYAIEQDRIITEAEKLAELNRLEKRIVFIRGRSDRVELPEKVDVVISEIIGHFGLDEHVLRFKDDARERFLKPGGKFIPSWLELYLVPVESEVIWRNNIGLWSNDFYSLDLSPVRNYAISQRYVQDCSGRVKQLAAPFLVSHIDFYKIEKTQSVFEGEFLINKKGNFHGFVGFHQTGLSQKIVISTSPENLLTNWGHSFFPLHDVVPVENGDRVTFRIKAIPQDDALFWEWDTGVKRNGVKKAKFSQSNFTITKEELVIGRSDFRPILSKEAEMMRRVLGLCNGNTTMGEIAEILMAEYPGEYKNLKDATRTVAGIVRGKVNI